MGRKLFLSEPEDRFGEDSYWLHVDSDEGPQVLRLVISAGSLHVTCGKDTELRVSLPEPDDNLVDEAFDRAVEALPERTELYLTHYTEKLSDEWIQRLFIGDNDKVLDELEEDGGYQEGRDSARWNVVEQHVDANDLDVLKQSGDKVHELFRVLDERDDSDPIRDMARNTGKRFVRYRLGEIDLLTMDVLDVRRAAGEIASMLGIEHNGPFQPAIRSILANADTAWGPRGLWLLFYADVEELIDACQDPADKRLVVTKPEVLLFNSATGAGWAEQIDTTVRVPFDRVNLKLDAKDIGNGWSWTEEVSAGGATDAAVSFFPAT
jgi:hypothetical protein